MFYLLKNRSALDGLSICQSDATVQPGAKMSL